MRCKWDYNFDQVQQLTFDKCPSLLIFDDFDSLGELVRVESGGMEHMERIKS